MLGFYALSEAPISSLAGVSVLSVGSAIGTATVTGVASAKAFSTGSAVGVATVSSISIPTYEFPMLQYLGKQPVAVLEVITKSSIALLETF